MFQNIDLSNIEGLFLVFGLAIIGLMFILFVLQRIIEILGMEDSPLAKPFFAFSSKGKKGGGKRRGTGNIKGAFVLIGAILFVMAGLFAISPVTAYSGTAGTTGSLSVPESTFVNWRTPITATELTAGSDYIIVTDGSSNTNLSFTANDNDFVWKITPASQTDGQLSVDLYGYNSTSGANTGSVLASRTILLDTTANALQEDAFLDLLVPLVTISIALLIVGAIVGAVGYKKYKS